MAEKKATEKKDTTKDKQADKKATEDKQADKKATKDKQADKKATKDKQADAGSKKDTEKKSQEKKKRTKIRPELSAETKHLLEVRDEISHRRPRFRRQEWFRYKKLGTAWRKPRGKHSKARMNKRYRPALVKAGYCTPKAVLGYHPSGFKEVMVHNPKDLDIVDPKVEAARIGHSVGTRKRMDIEERAEELGVRVLNKRV